MHESRLVADVLEEAARRAQGARIETISLEVGALAAVSEVGLDHGIGDSAEQRWGYRPVVRINWGEDPLQPTAQNVVLRSITVGDA